MDGRLCVQRGLGTAHSFLFIRAERSGASGGSCIRLSSLSDPVSVIFVSFKVLFKNIQCRPGQEGKEIKKICNDDDCIMGLEKQFFPIVRYDVTHLRHFFQTEISNCDK